MVIRLFDEATLDFGAKRASDFDACHPPKRHDERINAEAHMMSKALAF